MDSTIVLFLVQDAVINGAFDFSNSGRPAALTNSADIARWYAETAGQDLARLAGVTAEALLKVVDFRGLFQFPAGVFLQTALNHTIHHRGQLSAYIRPMGGKVPSIYGPSADDSGGM